MSKTSLKSTASNATGFIRGLMQYLPVVMPRASGDPCLACSARLAEASRGGQGGRRVVP